MARVASLFRKHCYSCHSGDEAEGELRIDMLDRNFDHADDQQRWLAVLERLEFGDMPPDTEPALPDKDRALLSGWVAHGLQRGEAKQNEVPSFRRLTRREYELSMQDLLGLPIDFGSMLPEDGKSKTGFRNDGDVLRMSPLQYETFLQIADEALAKAIVTGPPPSVHRYRIAVNDFRVEVLPQPEEHPGETFDYDSHPFEIINVATQPRRSPGGSRRFEPPPHPPHILPPSSIVRFREAAVRPPKSCVALRMHHAFRSGETVIKVRAARLQPSAMADVSRVPILTVAMGSTNYHGVELKTVGEPKVIDHTDSRTYEFRFRMENVSVPNEGPLDRRNASILAIWNSALTLEDEAEPPQLKIDWIEFENPVFETWPPKTHTDILFADDGLAERDYAREVIERFATRAYREPLEPEELDRLVDYWVHARASTDSVEVSLRETLAVVLSSPRFLGLPVSRTSKSSSQLSNHELASRLSYFLWSTLPDQPLVDLADQGKLKDPKVLTAQVRRMIQDPRSWSFIEQFTEQWLELDRLNRVVVDKESYPSFTHELADAMRLEPIHFFGEVLRNDLSLDQFIDSDFICVNDILATHYGIAGIMDPRFRKIPREDHLHRGGLLAQAGILTGLSDGHDGHPIKRGVWLLRNLLDDPPPPPPPNVPELNREEPALKGLTIPQALALHRNSSSCRGCHRKIDPWGIAFEEYDAVGNWQRSGRGAELRNKRTQFPIDAKTELPNGTTIDGLQDLRDELLRFRFDDFRRAMIRKVMAYALGRTLSAEDIEAANLLEADLRERGDRLSDLIELVVASKPFQSK